MSDIIDPLIPPYRFERVQDGLYRGGYPKPRNFRFLKRQRLKTILSLIPQTQDPHLTSFCHANNITLLTIKVESPNENVTVTNKIASQCLALLTNPTHAPLYLHCLDGSNVTGLIVMCLRKLQLWRVASYQNEYLRFELNGEIIPEESEFVDAYDGAGLLLSNPYSPWLWPGRLATDVNLMPFDNGVHPVLPHVRLAHRMSTEICVADPISSLNRSATDPALRDAVQDIVSEPTAVAAVGESDGTELLAESLSDPVAGTEDTIQMLVKSRRAASDSQNPTPAPTTVAPTLSTTTSHDSSNPTCLPASARMTNIDKAAGFSDSKTQHRRMASDATIPSAFVPSPNSAGLLHTSQSTGALSDALSGSRQSDTDTPSQSQMPSRTPLSGIHEVLEPVLAALTSARDFAESSARLLESRGRADAGDTSAANASQTRGSVTAATSGSLGTTASETEVSGAIREISLSVLVEALAIEGLGM